MVILLILDPKDLAEKELSERFSGERMIIFSRANFLKILKTIE
jgi:hypothetical protein